MKPFKLGIASLLVLALSATAWAGEIAINGSTTVLPIMQKVAEAYMAVHKEAALSVSGGGSGNGIKAIIDGAADIAMSSRQMKDKEAALAKNKGVAPKEIAIAMDALVPVVHPSNPVKDLALEQLQGIYMGKITNWKDVGGPDAPIVAISRDTSSGTYETWEEKVMHRERVFPGALLQASNGAVVQAVSKNRNAIGYIGIGYLDASTRAVSVGGVMGSADTALNGKYSIARNLYLYVNGEPSGEVAKIVAYVLDPAKGQKHVAEVGYVPLKK
ncbi:MAG: PstS family phosphate ABC transporter substrate-binding protein [Thermodesulfobacteriota bacterium]